MCWCISFLLSRKRDGIRAKPRQCQVAETKRQVRKVGAQSTSSGSAFLKQEAGTIARRRATCLATLKLFFHVLFCENGHLSKKSDFNALVEPPLARSRLECLGVHRLASFNSGSQSFNTDIFIIIVIVTIFMVMLPRTLAVPVARKERALLSPSNPLHRQQLPLFSCLATAAMLRLIPYLLLLLLALPGGTLAQTVRGCGSSALIYRNGVPTNSIDVMFRDSQTGASAGWGYIAMNLSALTLPEPIATDQTVPGTINIALKLEAFVGSIQFNVFIQSQFLTAFPPGSSSCAGEPGGYASFPLEMPQNVVFASTLDYNGLFTGILANPIFGFPQSTVDSTSPCARMVINELQIVIDPSCVESFPNSFRVTTVNGVTVSPSYSYKTWREQTYGVMTITSLASTFPVTPPGGLYVCLAMSRNSRCGTPAGLCYGNSCVYSLLNADDSCCPASQVPY
ncbi:hypothetical protein VOLCADRAFT_91705 [Volvox carteri f. nagariensis]|uniref:Pherophorin domain-containing protein n=1 Tax=Volvox carteri f. nagariensis TaxID=3068 RepID=D8TXS6_VOLCA|nr:uncharacterized protein VOLCADRAFT_91705 [Volvox carteri f. nagariensis]EFJ47776.1 hypothetical protein VOLCADRAFT_91705 [Volvox carteri f. nagariensis]|eukprot:XP_002951247.1 hypothetical protein VOLCADRAFT_91705 [Volvox carteri f. nagariensis]